MFAYEGYSGSSKFELILPDTRPQLVITLDDNARCYSKAGNPQLPLTSIKRSWIKGLHNQPVLFQSEQNAATFCIQFELTGLNRLLGIPAEELSGQFIDAESILGNEIADLRVRIMENPAFEGRVATVEQYLSTKFGARLMGKSGLESLVSRPYFGKMSLPEVSAALNYSPKHTITVFRKALGATPKQLQILQNVNKSIEILNRPNPPSIAQVAHDCNHFDQSHFIKNFKQITTMTPQTYLSLQRTYPHVLSVGD